MTTRPDELEAFKRSVNLTEYAASCGYELDRKASSQNSVVMVDDAGDKVVIARGRDGHWIYFSVRDEGDSGSIIDFAQHRGAGSLGEVRKLLRPWIGATNAPPPSARPARSSFVEDLQPIERDIAAVRARYEDMEPASGFHRYLVEERGLPAAILRDARFRDRLRVDARGNAVFPHFNREGLCGYEMVNAGFKGFAKGGAKGLWASSIRALDRELVIAESAIDALSYAALSGHAHRRFISLAGQVSPEQLELVAAAAEKLPSGVVTLALDNDPAGGELAARLRQTLSACSKEIREDRPGPDGLDWNDVLRSRGSSPPPPELGRG